jgi:hypothetical protein
LYLVFLTALEMNQALWGLALVLLGFLILARAVMPQSTAGERPDPAQHLVQRRKLGQQMDVDKHHHKNQALWGLALVLLGFLILARAVIVHVDWSLLLVFMVMFIHSA